jgi:excisionase family DNA binding protein
MTSEALNEVSGEIWVSPIQAARILGVGRATVWRYLKAGHLRSVRIGPRIRRIAIPRAFLETARVMAGDRSGGAP